MRENEEFREWLVYISLFSLKIGKCIVSLV